MPSDLNLSEVNIPVGWFVLELFFFVACEKPSKFSGL